MYAGHCDQIGMLVTYINDAGFVFAQTIGGWDPQQLIGQPMSIWTRGGRIPAVISRKPIHLLTPEERKKVVDLNDLWLDIGAADGKQASEMVSIGDPITLALRYQPLMGDLVSGPGMDNKTGMVVRDGRIEACSAPLHRIYGAICILCPRFRRRLGSAVHRLPLQQYSTSGRNRSRCNTCI